MSFEVDWLSEFHAGLEDEVGDAACAEIFCECHVVVIVKLWNFLIKKFSS